uniref:AT-hook motif nuclear-localized protein n=1 Tax=Kalanchoe fedtschenkoi TaxID=63787 RepID=A0A7N0US51_KALFE
MSFSLQHHRAVVCILSVSDGLISVATLAQPFTSGDTSTYEGIFEILSLSGSYVVITNSDGSRDTRGSLRVSFAALDSRLIGGKVAGRLIAASPVEVSL